ncbi:hypothetical protein M8C21_027648, partial [Ambrosia artemisiifolia]
GEAKHGRDIVGTQNIVINNVGNGRGQLTELVTVTEWEGHAFATSIVEGYKSPQPNSVAQGMVVTAKKRQINYARGEARHGRDFVGTQNIVINNVGNGRGHLTELVIVTEWEEHAFATSIVERYKINR